MRAEPLETDGHTNNVCRSPEGAKEYGIAMRRNVQTKGIFCLEGLWNNDLRDTTSVRPILELLRVNCDIEYIHGDCATKDAFEFYLKKWAQRTYDAFPILFLSSHGDEFNLCLGHHSCDLDGIAEMLEGKCRNRIVIFASCKTLDVDKRHLTRFLRRTDALALCGYRLDVDWMRSAAFEMLLLSEMQENEFSLRGIAGIKSKATEMAKVFKDLEFRMVTAKECT